MSAHIVARRRGRTEEVSPASTPPSSSEAEAEIERETAERRICGFSRKVPSMECLKKECMCSTYQPSYLPKSLALSYSVVQVAQNKYFRASTPFLGRFMGDVTRFVMSLNRDKRGRERERERERERRPKAADD